MARPVLPPAGTVAVVSVALVLVAGFAGAFTAPAVGPTDAAAQSEPEVWTRTYGAGPGASGFLGATPVNDGGYLLVGWFGATDAPDEREGFAVRVDETGETEWLASFQGPGDGALRDAHPLDDGGFLVAGTTGSFDHDGTGRFVARLSPDGEVVWRRTYDRGRIEALLPATGDDGDRVWAVGGDRATLLGPDGGVIQSRFYGGIDVLAGTPTDEGYVVVGRTGDGEGAVAGLDPEGVIQWRDSVPETTFRAVTTTGGTVVAVGESEGGTVSAHYAPEGERKALRTHPGAGVPRSATRANPGALVATDDGSLVVIGAGGTGGSRTVATDLGSVDWLGGTRYLVAGANGSDAHAGVLEVRTALEPIGGDGTAAADGDGDGSGGDPSGVAGSDGPGGPLPGVGLPDLAGFEPSGTATAILVAAAVVAALAAVGVTVLAVRSLR